MMRKNDNKGEMTLQKRKILELDNEIIQIKKDSKYYKIKELETDIEAGLKEQQRLRAQVQDLILDLNTYKNKENNILVDSDLEVLREIIKKQ